MLASIRPGQSADAVPTLGRNVSCATERDPDILRIVARLKSLDSRPMREFDQGEISGEGPAVDESELVGYGSPKFAYSHSPTRIRSLSSSSRYQRDALKRSTQTTLKPPGKQRTPRPKGRGVRAIQG